MKKRGNWIAGIAFGIALATQGAWAGDLSPERFGKPVDLGAPLTNISIQHCVVGNEAGEPIVYYTVAGNPAIFHVVGLKDYRLIATYELPKAARAWTHAIAPDGTVYIGGVATGGSGHLYRYVPGGKRVDDLGPGIAGHKFIWALAAGDDGRIYGGTWEGGHVFEYNPADGKTQDLGRVDATEDYVRSIAWHGGFVYAGTGTRNGRIWRVDPRTGEKERIEIPMRAEYADDFDRMRSVYHLAVAGDHLFAFFNQPRLLLVYDTVKREWWDEAFPGIVGPVSGTYSEADGRFYYQGREDSLWAVDVKTRTEEKVMRYRGAYRGGNWIESDDPAWPGQTLATVSDSGNVMLLNPETGRGRTLDRLAEGQETPLQALEVGPGGMLYVSGYMGSSGAVFDPATGESRMFPLGQAEGLATLGDEVFWGIYPGAHIMRQKPLGGDLRPEALLQVQHRQDRPFAMLAADEKIFIGTIPDYGQLGGALTILSKGEDGEINSAVHPLVVAEQSIVGLAYHEPTGLLFGSTSIFGGLGIDPTETAAKLFVWDVATEKKVAEFSVDLPEVESPSMIGGLTAGPDGLIWGAVNGVLFALDPETREVVKHRNIYPDVTRYGRWRPAHLRWGADGLLYANLGGRLTAVDPETLQSLSLGEESGLMTIGNDGSIYFAKGPRLNRISVATPTRK